MNAWALYDTANSVYSLCIATAIFPPFYESMTTTRDPETGVVLNDMVDFFGWSIKNSALYEYALSAAFLFIALLSPILSGIADYTGNKKSFMRFFVYLGAGSASLLYFFDGSNVELAIFAFMGAAIGFSGSFVYYNSYLPEICTPDRYEKLSAKGYSFGYGGSVFLLLLNLMMIQMPQTFGLPDSAVAARVSLLMVGIWWLGWAQYTFYHLPSTSKGKGFNARVMGDGFRELKRVFASLKTLPKLRGYLGAFFFLSMGMQTVMLVAALFGKKELNLPTAELILVVLIIQLIAIPGAYFFAWAANRIGNIMVLALSGIVWAAVCLWAHFITESYQFYIIACAVGLVMGGAQSLSRATYTRLLNKDKDTSSYYSFYDAAEKFSIVIGTLSYGVIDHYFGMRQSVLALAVFFIIAILLLYRIRKVR